jgi:hypothetical protein
MVVLVVLALVKAHLRAMVLTAALVSSVLHG